MTIYAKRENLLEQGEHQWRADPVSLVWTRPSGDSLTILWPDVTGIRAAFAPTKWKPWRHVLELGTRQGRRLLIDNGHFRGVGDFEDRSPAFTAFVLACLVQIAAQAPEAKGWLGPSPGAYLSQLAALGAMLVLLGTALLLPISQGLPALLKLLLFSVCFAAAMIWAIRSRPRPTSLTAEGFFSALPKVSM